jgi:hypothetical protein
VQVMLEGRVRLPAVFLQQFPKDMHDRRGKQGLFKDLGRVRVPQDILNLSLRIN